MDIEAAWQLWGTVLFAHVAKSGASSQVHIDRLAIRAAAAFLAAQCLCTADFSETTQSAF